MGRAAFFLVLFFIAFRVFAAEGPAPLIDCSPLPTPTPAATPAPVPPEPMVFDKWPLRLIRPTANTRTYYSRELFVRVTQLPNVQFIVMIGKMFNPDQELANQVVASLIPNKPILLRLAMGGGNTGITETFVNGYRSSCPKGRCRIETQVVHSFKCASNCITLFMVGDVRTASTTAQFGFHAAAEGSTIADGVVQDIYGKAGIKKQWLASNSSMFSTLNLTYLVPSQFSQANIVTKLIPGDAPSPLAVTPAVPTPPVVADQSPFSSCRINAVPIKLEPINIQLPPLEAAP